jgi:dynein heavy chain
LPLFRTSSIISRSVVRMHLCISNYHQIRDLCFNFQLREPPLEGIFLYGLYMWGCAWEKTTGDLMDAPPRHGPTPLPVVHITVVPQSEKQSLHDPQKAAVSYSCPCYPSRICPREPVLMLDIDNKDVSASRWPLRGLCATLRPF